MSKIYRLAALPLVTDIAVLRRIVAGLGIPPGYVGLAYCTCQHYDGGDW